MKKPSPKYLAHIRTLPCLVCQQPAEAHHLMIIGRRGMGMKTEDKYAVPLCHPHHMELHMMGDEFSFWVINETDPITWAKEEWEKWIKKKQ